MTNAEQNTAYLDLAQLELITGLTDRTLRSYLRQGLLHGDKSNGRWRFTPQQIQAFLTHPAVTPSIRTKQTGIVTDFLLDTKKKQPAVCMIFDLPDATEERTAQYFCDAISRDASLEGVSFAYDGLGGTPRVILSGDPEQLLPLVQNYFHKP